MSSRNKAAGSHSSLEKIRQGRKSWKEVTKAEKYFFEGNTGKALPILFRYENCEARAMLFLAYMYFDGYGAVQDMPRGVSYLQKLINFENYRSGEEGLLAIALYQYGELCFKGFVLPKDDALAKRYWLRGAKIKKNISTGEHFFGVVQCQRALGMYYSNPQYYNPKKAFMWHKRAKESGNIASKGALGVMYLRGIGTEKNLKLAYKYLTHAADSNTFAKGHLTAYYFRRKLFHKAATIGNELDAEKDIESLAKQENCTIKDIKKGIAMGCYYLALCLEHSENIGDIEYAKELITKAIKLSPEVAYDIHAKAILGIA